MPLHSSVGLGRKKHHQRVEAFGDEDLKALVTKLGELVIRVHASVSSGYFWRMVQGTARLSSLMFASSGTTDGPYIR
jgi:hypothetical protein